METYLLKFSACLCVFWLVYVLFLERQNMHRFKRFYLLGVLIFALIIPTLTITEYVEPVSATLETAPVFFPMELAIDETTIEEAPFFNLETTLWLIYGFGVLLFASRFIINLIKMQRRISKNENIKKRSFIYVLLHENTIPHSFFRYIFFNKTRYESDNIPKEVLLHEETHAKQLHSLDIIILELLQIVFWFHPLIYILKHHIKLNHEFLADQAVLKQGTDTKVYQHILLQFSSNTQNHQLSSAINYSSIKKRFTVMKTQTSKTRVWLSTLLVLPIIAVLFYNFAEKEYIEKEESSTIDHVEHIKDELKKTEELQIHYVDQNVVEIYLKKYDIYEALRTTEPHYINKSKQQQEELDDMFSDLGGLYYRLSKENKAKVKRPTASISPYAKITLNGKTYFKKQSELTAEERATLPAPPPPPLSIQNTNYNLKEKPIMVILINRNGELLVKDNYTSLESIESKLKTFSKSFDDSNSVFLRYDTSVASEKTLNKVIALVRKYDFKIIQADASQIAPPPPPAKQQDSKSIKPVEILIKEDNSLILNNKPIKFDELVNEVSKLNSHLTIEERRSYITASILTEANKSIDYARKVQQELTKADIWSSSIGYNKNSEKNDLEMKHVSPYARLTVEEAKIEKEKSLKEYKDYKQPKNSPWAITMGKAEIVEDPEQKSSPIEINGATYYYTQQNGKTTYYDRYGKMVDINQIPPPPPIPNDATPEQKAKMQKATDAYMKANPDKVGTAETTEGEIYEVIEIPDDLQGSVDINGETFYYTTSLGKTTYFNRYGKEVKMDNLPPPPPAPESTLDFVIRMAKSNAKFFNEGKSISSDEAIALLKKNPKLNINAQKTDTEHPLIYISKKPILIRVNGKVGEQMSKEQESILPIVNGKTITSGKIALTRNEIKDITLSTKNGKVTEFKFKIPGQPTQHIKSNVLDIDALKHLESAKKDDQLVLFALKDGSNSEIAPIVITVTD